MPTFDTRSLGRGAKHTPGLKRLPVAMLVAAAELSLLAHDHLTRLNPDERRRLLDLARKARGRRRNLSDADREELAQLIAKVEPREFAGHAVEKLSPIPLPQRLVHGRRAERS